MSGQLKKFRPVDFILHWVQGDIVIKDSEGADSHIQLKQTGGHFKVGFNTEYFEKDKNGKQREMDITGQVVHTYASGNVLTFGYNHLNYPSIATLYKEVKKSLKK